MCVSMYLYMHRENAWKGTVSRDYLWGMGLDKGLRGDFNFLFYTLFLGGRVDVVVELGQTLGTYQTPSL